MVFIDFTGLQDATSYRQTGTPGHDTPGPDFWSWSPPKDTQSTSANGATSLQLAKKPNPYPLPSTLLLEKEKPSGILPLSFESMTMEDSRRRPLPPLQSVVDLEKVQTDSPAADISSTAENEVKLGVLFSRHAAEAAEALGKSEETSSHGVHLDGSKWWKETGIEERPDGVVCKWTLIRGLNADETVEWEDKFWEASNEFEYKELGAVKSGRDAAGNVWREYWKESMWQVNFNS